MPYRSRQRVRRESAGDVRLNRHAPTINRVAYSSPRLHIAPVGLLSGGGPVSPLCDLIRPTIFASRVTLSSEGAPDATAVRASFLLSQGLVDCFQAGDQLHLTLTPRGALGLSLFRDGNLMVALGAVTAVPLGDLHVIVRRDRLSMNAAPPGVSKWKPPGLYPLEVTSRDEPPRKPEGYQIRVWYRAWPPPEDADECLSIVRRNSCPTIEAYATTHLLAMSDALHIER
jgi:hypothetical protein